MMWLSRGYMWLDCGIPNSCLAIASRNCLKDCIRLYSEPIIAIEIILYDSAERIYNIVV